MITVEEARFYYTGEDAAHDFEHVLRVLRLAERIGPAEGADMDVLRAAVLLHDIARIAEDQGGPCHATVASRQARTILAGHPPHKVEAVAHAIASHRFRNSAEPQSLEARILYDADKLDAMGAIGVARAYAIAGRHGQRLWAAVPRSYSQRTRQESRGDVADAHHTPVHEFVYKLSQLKESLFTDTARAIAQSRHDYMVSFFARLEEELEGGA